MHVINSLDGGGTERMLVHLLRGLAAGRDGGAAGMTHAVCTLRSAGPLADDLPPTVTVTPLNAAGRDRWAAVRLAALCRRLRVDVVHARNTGTWKDAAAACRLAGRPRLVLGFGGLDDAMWRGGLTGRGVPRWLKPRGTTYTSVSEAGRRQLVDELGIDPERIRVVHNGVDIRRFAPTSADACEKMRASLGINLGEIVVLAVGSLTEVKDHATLVGAVARAASPRLRLLIAGEGPLRADLFSLAESLGVADRCRLLGHREDVPDLLAAADVFVQSSRYEGMSNSLLEAMACGPAIIATDVGDSAEMLNHGQCGLLTPGEDGIAVAAAIDRLSGDRALRRQLGVRARRRVQECYTIERAIAEYERLYRETMHRRTERMVRLSGT